MRAVSLVVLLLVVSTFARTEPEYKTAFVEWITAFKKAYTSDEFLNRFEVFKANLDFVDKWDAKSKGFEVGLNDFADLTNEEFKKIYHGLSFDYDAYLAKDKKNLFTVMPSAPLPASVDWVTAGAVTGIKNQGQCGSCWSFSSTGSIEGSWELAGNPLVGLSEQNLMDCSTAEGNNGCDGGLMDYAFEYVIKNNGIDSEASYPYEGFQGTCKYKESNKAATISSYSDIPTTNETALTYAIAGRPVSVAIDAAGISFQLYKTGVYYDFLCSSTKLDHGVLAVGYGTESGIFGAKDYYIVKNSWGTKWGQAGYIWMSRNRDNNCGIATAASYPIH